MSKPQYKLSVSNVFLWPVKVTMLDEDGVQQERTIEALFKRKPMSEVGELQQKLEADQDGLAFIREILAGWKSQDLLLLEDGTPAPFNDDTLAAMVDVAGVATEFVWSYGDAVRGALRRKN